MLYVEFEVASDATERADRGGHGLRGWIPLTRFSEYVLADGLQRAGWADANAVAAVDTGGLRKFGIVFGSDANIEAAAGRCDSKGELSIGAAGFDAFVAHDAPGIVAHIKLVIDLDGLRDGLSGRAVRIVVVPRVAVVAVIGWSNRWTVALRVDTVGGDPSLHITACLRQVNRRSEQFQHHAPAVANPLGISAHLHAVLDLAGAARDECPRAFNLDDAHP